MEDLTVKQHQDRQYKIKVISKGIAFTIVGAVICWFGGLWPWIIGGVLALAGIGIVIQVGN